MNRVSEYAKDHVQKDERYEEWADGHDGASLIARLLFTEATDIYIFVGTAINPAHQNPDLEVSFNLKMNIVSALKDSLQKMGKNVRLSAF